ncbi:MAG TPA: sigma-70 family RNA polymerase sigma factor [Acidimicrobiia bacterium]|nr:sigma-70 family RNA polymerase sigma factor [Acidimicrobiia bacterium]
MTTKLTSTEQNALVTDTMDLVGHIVSELSARYPRHVDRSELWNAGALGLVEASRRFDPASGVPFARYAAIRIRGAIIDSTRSRDWASRSVRRSIREIRQATTGLEENEGRTPTSAEVAAFLAIEPSEFEHRRSQAIASTLLHLDQSIEGEEVTLAERIADPAVETVPEIALELRELRGTLAEAIRNLPPVQAVVVSRSYLDGNLLQDIAVDMSLTEARVSQIRSEGLAALKAYFSTQYEGVEAASEDAPGKRARVAYLERMESSADWRRRIDSASLLDAAAEGVMSLLGSDETIASD